MVIISDSLVQNVVLVFITSAITVYVYFKWKWLYWKKRGYPFIEPKFPLGTVQLSNPLKYMGIQIKENYDTLKSTGCKLGGLYALTVPKCLITDPHLIRIVLQQDFENFTERGFYHNEKDDPLSANLFALGGERWRRLRATLSPAFTPGKIKIMFDSLVQCAVQMRNAIDEQRLHSQSIDAKEVMACYTTDVIGSCAFGLECNSFLNSNAEFRRHGKQTFDFSSKFRLIKVAIASNWPNLARWLGVTLFDKDSNDFFINVVKDAVTYRKANNVFRKDMLQLLMVLKNDTESQCEDQYIGDGVIKELAAQVFIFFAAGFETSSTTLTFCLYELATNLAIQDKLRAEIVTVLAKHGDEITYDAIMEMKYMNRVINETLRKYPPVAVITRQCEKNYNIPDTDFVLEKDMEVVISVMGLHHDPQYHPDPEKFDPDRFSEENVRDRVPFTYIPFGEGPRICIGLRFGLMQIKIGLTTLLKEFRISLNEISPVSLEFEAFSFTLLPKSEVLLDFQKLEQQA